MILELINPSDAVTFIGDDKRVAGVAILFLGNGQYALKDIHGETFVPLMLFGGHEPWLKENEIDLDTFIPEHAEEIAAFLETCCYGSAAEREAFDEAISRMTPDKAAEHQAWWNDRNRSSMNNIGRAASSIAKQLRDKYATATAV